MGCNSCKKDTANLLLGKCSIFFSLLIQYHTNYSLLHTALVSLNQEILQTFASGRMTQFAQRFRLDLANTLTGNIKFLSYFFQGSRPSVFQSKTQAYYLALTVSQGFQGVLSCSRSRVKAASSAGARADHPG